jgi:hypothetical protein
MPPFFKEKAPYKRGFIFNACILFMSGRPYMVNDN